MREYYERYLDSEVGGYVAEIANDKIVLEGRDELLQVLTALRKAGNHTLAKKLWEIHTGFGKCPRCQSLSKHFLKGYYSFRMGYEVPVCEKCYNSLQY